jgi:homoserine dehydrogenase
MTKKIRTIMSGLGSVNGNLLAILEMKAERLKNQYGLEFVVVAAADSSGTAIAEKGLGIGQLRKFKQSGGQLSDLPEGTTAQITETIKTIESDLVLEGSPANLKHGDPGLTVTRAALERGLTVVLANKAPLVLDYAGIQKLVKRHGGQLAFSATVCGPLPVVNIGTRDHVAADITLFKGILNSTSNFVLSEMGSGRSYDAAVAEAQRRGIAEADPTLDVEGWDTASKLVIIANSFLENPASLGDVKVEGITGISQADLGGATAKGKTIKLLATATKTDGKFTLIVHPTILEKTEFLAHCDSWEMGIEIHSDIYGKMFHKNRDRTPGPTAAAMLRDAVNLLR